MDFNNRLDSLLYSQGLTRASLAQKTGIPKRTIYSWAEGSCPAADKALVVAKFLGTTMEYLMNGTSSPYEVPARYRELFKLLDRLDDTQLAMIHERAATLAEINGGASFGDNQSTRHA